MLTSTLTGTIASMLPFRVARSQQVAESVPTPADAVGWALGDIALLQPIDRPFQRYVWIPPWGTPDWIGAINFGVNTAASHSQVIQIGTTIAQGWMVRFDLRRLAPKGNQFTKLVEVWDGLAIDDPYFHVPAENSKIRAAVLAPHLKQDEAVVLAGLSFSGGAIYRADWFLYKMLSTLEGGRYYDFLQIDRKPKAGTVQQAWLASLGIFEFATEELGGDQRSAVIRSGVTGKPRQIVILHGLGRGGNLAAITHDITDDDVQAEKHPIRNLLKFKDAAREIIVERPNGTHAFALFNSKGELQDAVPDNIARDSTIPLPHTARLQPAIGCVRCHGQGTHDGWQPFGNDVQRILGSGLDVFTDLADVKNTREQIIDRLASLYAGDLDGPDAPLGRARRDYLATAFRITGGPRLAGDVKQVSAVAKVSETLGAIYAQYRYDAVTPERAAFELGLKGAGLGEALGPVVPGVVVDPLLGTLRAGIAINRSDWETIYSDAALVAEQRRKEKK